MAVDRDALARFVHRGISELARGAAWSTETRMDGDDVLAQGDYTDAIDTALMEQGYVDEDGLPDSSLVDALDFLTLAETVKEESLERLLAYYSTVVDTVGGPIRIYRSQVAKALSMYTTTSGSGRKVQYGAWGSLTAASLLQDDF